MRQITIYLDDKVLARLTAQVRTVGGSRSQWIADAVRMRLNREWPAPVRKRAGVCPNFPQAADKKASRRLHERERLERSFETLRFEVGKRAWKRADLYERT